MELIFHVLYSFTTALLVPVVVVLLLLMGWSLFQVGTLLREWRERRRGDVAERWFEPAGRHVAKQVRGEESNGVDELLAVELRMADSLAKLRWAVRLGPMLGLMGTLIPMGPALMQFADGDFAAASANIVIAFGTTVVGLAIAAACYTLWQIRRLWYAHDLAELECLTNEQEEDEPFASQCPSISIAESSASPSLG